MAETKAVGSFVLGSRAVHRMGCAFPSAIGLGAANTAMDEIGAFLQTAYRIEDERIQIMTVGIIGAGLIGAAFARRLAQANFPGILSNSRGPDSLADLVADIGGAIRAGTRDEAAAQDMVLVAVNWSKLPTALRAPPRFSRSHRDRCQQSDRTADLPAR